MYRILVVDDDATSLMVAKACLKRWNYQVTAVTHALEALSILSQKDGNEKPFDVVLSDVHMPIMDGFELMHHVNEDFNIPVVLISADDRAEVIFRGLRTAPAYLLKPIKADHVRHLWQYSVLWKNKEKNAYKRVIQSNISRSICSSSSFSDSDEDIPRAEKKTRAPLWDANLHSRFVEVLLILGPIKAVPKNIVEVMNVPSLSREQVASHLQKFRKYLATVLDGKTNLDKCPRRWIDYNYYSSIVGGNPNKIFIDQLFEQRRTGNLAAPIPTSVPLPPFNEVETSSSRRRNVANTPAPGSGLGPVTFQSAVNVAAPTLLGGESLQSATNLNLGNIVENNFNVNLQVGNVQLHDPNIGSSLNTNQFGETIEMNPNIQIDPNITGLFGVNDFGNATYEQGEEYWADLLHVELDQEQ